MLIMLDITINALHVSCHSLFTITLLARHCYSILYLDKMK